MGNGTAPMVQQKGAYSEVVVKAKASFIPIPEQLFDFLRGQILFE